MSRPVIQIENLSKAYQIGQIGTGTFSRDLERFWITKVLGKEDPFLKIGETNDRSIKGESDIVWSLKDINFEVSQGDAVGIIGKNGAGKSTLLKLLSRVTSPTTGEIKVKGRVASLLEVGTGFHPELTGRENIFLNGAILGMRKKEITRKLDEIIDFSGVERYIDTPVKRYSSGMYVRLAFAVAAHLESEILIVDEVLAVGDVEFQKKCLGKMGDISKGEGRTLLFVSHNMSAVKSLCSKGIFLENGLIVCNSSINNVLDSYLKINYKRNRWIGEDGSEIIKLLKAVVYSENDNEVFLNTNKISIVIEFELQEKFKDLVIGVSISSGIGNPIIGLLYNDYNDLNEIGPGLYQVVFIIPPYTLATGDYEVSFNISIPFVKQFTTKKSNLTFEINAEGCFGNRFFIQNNPYYNSLVRPNWFESIKKIR
jgi:lipopolysaccharide transport system ATP-binding protein